MKEAIIKLLKIKSIVTILLKLTFVAGVLLQQIMSWELPEALVNIYMMIIGFYFGTQIGKDDQNGPTV